MLPERHPNEHHNPPKFRRKPSPVHGREEVVEGIYGDKDYDDEYTPKYHTQEPVVDTCKVFSQSTVCIIIKN